MRILITNDDSISSEVLLPLTKWAKQFGEVTVIVPKYEQSGKSHGIEIHKPFEVVKIEFAPGIEAYTVDSTPADCVRFALFGLHKQFDVVISGINRGLNLGRDLVYSGTVGAVMESAYQEIPYSIALSTEPGAFEEALTQLDRIYAYFKEHQLFQKHYLYNVNIPCNTTGEIRITRQGGPYFGDEFKPLEHNLYQPIGSSIFKESLDKNIDTNAVLVHKCISITPLETDRTCKLIYEELSGLNE